MKSKPKSIRVPYQAFTRASLDGAGIFRNIQEVLFWLCIGYRPRYPVPSPDTPSNKAYKEAPGPIRRWEALTAEDTKQITVILNTQLKLLSKVLPDLKAVELSDSSDVSRFSDMELAQRLESFKKINRAVSLGSSEAPSAPLYQSARTQ